LARGDLDEWGGGLEDEGRTTKDEGRTATVAWAGSRTNEKSGMRGGLARHACRIFRKGSVQPILSDQFAMTGTVDVPISHQDKL
jgi:hypothetical protein